MRKTGAGLDRQSGFGCGTVGLGLKLNLSVDAITIIGVTGIIGWGAILKILLGDGQFLADRLADILGRLATAGDDGFTSVCQTKLKEADGLCRIGANIGHARLIAVNGYDGIRIPLRDRKRAEYTILIGIHLLLVAKAGGN